MSFQNVYYKRVSLPPYTYTTMIPRLHKKKVFLINFQPMNADMTGHRNASRMLHLL